jgi:RNA polymerase sigma-70 factor, ECF subfamily
MDFKERDSEDLFTLIQSGNEDAFAELYRRYHAGIFRYAWQMSGSRSTAEDILQEVFLTFIQKMRAYDRSRGSLSSYLYGIARNMVMRWLEENQVKVVTSNEEQHEVIDPVTNPLAELSRGESIRRVRMAIMSLPARYREVIVLCELQEVAYSGAAEVIGCSIGTVRSRLHRARALLIRKLESLGLESPEKGSGGMRYELPTI